MVLATGINNNPAFGFALILVLVLLLDKPTAEGWRVRVVEQCWF
jgi:hypothetical protein